MTTLSSQIRLQRLLQTLGVRAYDFGTFENSQDEGYVWFKVKHPDINIVSIWRQDDGLFNVRFFNNDDLLFVVKGVEARQVGATVKLALCPPRFFHRC